MLFDSCTAFLLHCSVVVALPAALNIDEFQERCRLGAECDEVTPTLLNHHTLDQLRFADALVTDLLLQHTSVARHIAQVRRAYCYR